METGMTLALLNQTDEIAILAKNYSRSGVYFESQRKLRRGTVIVLRAMDCANENNFPTSIPRPFFCTGVVPESKACRELRFPTVAWVTRCDKLAIAGRERYGVAADNLRLTD
jgi:hypothetical protein